MVKLTDFETGTDLFEVVQGQVGENLNLPNLIEKVRTQSLSERELRTRIDEILPDRSTKYNTRVELEAFYCYIVQECYIRYRNNEPFNNDEIEQKAAEKAQSFLNEWWDILMKAESSRGESTHEKVMQIIEENKDDDRETIETIIRERLDISESTASGYFARANKELGKPIAGTKNTIDIVREVVQDNEELDRKALTEKLVNDYSMKERTAYQYVGKVLKELQES